MSLEPIQQFEALLKKSKKVLILLPKNPTGDLVGAGWAFYFFLKKERSIPQWLLMMSLPRHPDSAFWRGRKTSSTTSWVRAISSSSSIPGSIR